jgi:hypothetical protein
MVKEIKAVEIFVVGELVGDADCIITDDFGRWYGDLATGDKLQDNGEFVAVDGYGVEIR